MKHKTDKIISTLENKFEVYRTYLIEEACRLASYIALYRRLEERRADRTYEINFAPAFFWLVFDALNSAIIHWVNNLFDEKAKRGIFNFLTFIEHNRDIFEIEQLRRRVKKPDAQWILEKEPITLAMVDEDRKHIKSLPCLQSFKTRRDKYYGHFDKKYFFDRERLERDAPITRGDFNKVVELLEDIVNRYSSSYDGQLFPLELANINDIDHLLDRLHKCTK